MIIVECSAVRKVYDEGENAVVALDGVDLSLERGDFVSLSGPSGSGKTTLLNLIGGLDTPTSGSIFVNGHAVHNLSQTQRAELRLRELGFIFQAYNLIPVLSARENVEFVMELQGVASAERRERSHAILAEVGLGGMENRRPGELSGGQQQRVAVARAIVSKPSIVLADEPTANLDSHTAQSLLELMRKLNEEHRITFIFSTHDPRVIEMARRSIRLRDGKIDTEA